MTTSDLHVALFPMNIVWENKGINLDTLRRVAEQLHPDTDLLILPETFSTGFPSGDKELIRTLAERITEASIDYIKEISAYHNISIA